MTSKRKHKTLALKDKMDLLNKLDRGENMCKLAKEYGVGRATIHDLKRNKQKIVDHVNTMKSGPGKRKTLRVGNCPKVENALYVWFMQQRSKHTSLSGDILKAKAIEFYKKTTKKDDFRASDGWLAKFKKRFGIRLSTISAEKLSSDESAVQPFFQHFKDKVEELGLLPDQIYDADESELFWRLLPNKTFVSSTQATAPGRQLVFNQAAPSTSTTEQQPSTSAAEQLQYQPSRYSIVSGNKSALVEEIVIKEEITDEERNQCRLCLSVGRRMQELGEYAPLYRKLLFENNYQHTTIPSFMFSMLACWECIAELKRVKRFQEKVRRANNAFETNQNQKCENLSNLSTILIGDYTNSNAGDNRPTSIEDCAQDIKEEAVEAEVEETSLPDPLAVEQDVKTTGQESEIYLEIEHEPNTSITPKKVVKRPIPQPKPNERQPKRTKLDQNVANPEPLRGELDQSGSKTPQKEEDYPRPVAETDCDSIFGKVKVEIDELEKILTERRNKESFKSMKFKCDSCVLGFTDHNRLLEHNRNFHDEEVGSCECDICERRFDDDSLLSAHYRNHFVKFVCKLCNFECYTKTGRTIHFKRHKGALQGTSLEALLRKKLASEQRASAGGSSRQTSS